MKEIKCLVPFAGIVSMAVGEVREVSEEVAADLIQAGYAEEIKEIKKAKETKSKKGD